MITWQTHYTLGGEDRSTEHFSLRNALHELAPASNAKLMRFYDGLPCGEWRLQDNVWYRIPLLAGEEGKYEETPT